MVARDSLESGNSRSEKLKAAFPRLNAAFAHAAGPIDAAVTRGLRAELAGQIANAGANELDDAEHARRAALLTARQVQAMLNRQSVGIANRRPDALEALFR
jgi:hypothetical protein